MAQTSIPTSAAERLSAAYMEGAESRMIEVRGYGLTTDEAEEAKAEAPRLYGHEREAR